MGTKIIKCSDKDIDSVWKIVDSCSKWLHGKGMDHWKDYWKEDIIQDNIENAITYGILLGNNIAGVACLDERISEYYRQDYLNLCQNSSANATYINMLGINPSYHKKGLASKLVIFLEDCARESNIDFIRLNAFTEYRELNQFYLKRGYSFLGSVIDGDGDEMSFYEKRLCKD